MLVLREILIHLFIVQIFKSLFNKTKFRIKIIMIKYRKKCLVKIIFFKKKQKMLNKTNLFHRKQKKIKKNKKNNKTNRDTKKNKKNKKKQKKLKNHVFQIMGVGKGEWADMVCETLFFCVF